MVSHAPMFVDLDGSGNGMTALDGRRALAGLIGTTVRPVAALPSATSSGSNMQITVAQNVWQVGDVSDAAATFLGAVDAFTVTPAAGPASGVRTDSIVLKPDNPKNSDADPYLTPSLLPGTTSGPPAIPAGYSEIARVAVPAGVSVATGATVTFLHPSALAPLAEQTPTAPTYNGTTIGQRALGADGIEYRWNGTAWRPWVSSWTSYQPNGAANQISNFGGGSSTVTASWRYVDGEVEVRMFAQLGAGGGAYGDVTMGLPVTATYLQNFDVLGDGKLTKPGTNVVKPVIGLNTSTSLYIRVLATIGASPSALNEVGIGASTPFSWASGDWIGVRFRYTPA